MLCLKNHRQWIYSLLFVLSVAFISLFGLSSDSFAAEDLVYTIDSSNYSTAFDVCNNSSDIVCTPYHYFYLSLDESTISSYPSLRSLLVNFIIGFPGSQANPSFRFFGSFILEPLDSSVNRVRFTGINNYVSGLSFTITLSESNPFASPGPTGNIDITSNGTYDVTNYATATVNVENEVIQGDYHDDLVSINNSILIVAAVGLVIYFFYAIYRMLIGGRK